MTKILFVCHGNICRSPMAEFVMKDLVEKAGLDGQFTIASAATSTEEIGNPVYPPVRRMLAQHGISCAGKTARQLRRDEYADWNLFIGMDAANLRNMEHIFGGDPAHKVHALLDYTARPAKWPTPGTPAISKALGGMCRKAAPACCVVCPSEKEGKRRPRFTNRGLLLIGCLSAKKPPALLVE